MFYFERLNRSLLLCVVADVTAEWRAALIGVTASIGGRGRGRESSGTLSGWQREASGSTEQTRDTEGRESWEIVQGISGTAATEKTRRLSTRNGDYKH